MHSEYRKEQHYAVSKYGMLVHIKDAHKSNDDFYESDLEQALITHLQKFLLELGRGFSFVARQKRITFDGRHFRIDLVFYNYILKSCF